MSSSTHDFACANQLDRVRTIARLNDELRCGRKRGDHNLIVTTDNVNALLNTGNGILDQLFARGRLFRALSAWQPERPSAYDQHDFGSFEFEGTRLLFKIDYYARRDFMAESEDPTKPHLTCRVLTIMRPSDC